MIYFLPADKFQRTNNLNRIIGTLKRNYTFLKDILSNELNISLNTCNFIVNTSFNSLYLTKAQSICRQKIHFLPVKQGIIFK